MVAMQSVLQIIANDRRCTEVRIIEHVLTGGQMRIRGSLRRQDLLDLDDRI